MMLTFLPAPYTALLIRRIQSEMQRGTPANLTLGLVRQMVDRQQSADLEASDSLPQAED